MSEAEFWTTRQVAAWLGLTEATLRVWRARGKGPPFVRPGGERGRVRYPVESLKAWLESKKGNDGGVHGTRA